VVGGKGKDERIRWRSCQPGTTIGGRQGKKGEATIAWLRGSEEKERELQLSKEGDVREGRPKRTATRGKREKQIRETDPLQHRAVGVPYQQLNVSGEKLGR